MKKNKISIPLLILFFYFLFPIPFKGIRIYQTILIYGICGLGIILNFDVIKKYVKTKYFIFAIVAYAIIIIVSILIPIFYKTYDFTYFSKMLNIAKFSLITVFFTCIFIKKHKEEATVNLYMKYYIISCCILVTTTCIFLMLPSLKDFWTKIIDVNANTERLIEQENYISRFSIIGFSGFRQTFMCMLSVVFSIYLLQTENKSITNIVGLLMSLLGNLYYGRIGLLLSILCSALLFFKLKYNKKVIKNIIIIGIIIGIVFSIILVMKDKNQTINTWYNWAFSLFMTEDITTNRSVKGLMDMWFLPEMSTFFFGDGLYTAPEGGYYMHTDVGYLRPILFYGIIFTICGYLIFVFIIKGVEEGYAKQSDKLGKKMAKVILLAVAMFEIKGETFQTAVSLIIPLYILLGYMKNSIKAKIKDEQNKKDVDNCRLEK